MGKLEKNIKFDDVEVIYELITKYFPITVFKCLNDENYTMLYVNEEVYHLTGYTKEEFLDKKVSFASLMDTSDNEKVKKEIDKSFIQNKDYIVNYRIKTRYDSWRFVEEKGKVIQSDDGKIIIEGFIRDVTNEKRKEIELKNNERKFHDLFEKASDAIFIADAETGLLVGANRKAQQLIGKKESEIIGMHQQDLHPKEEIKRAKESFNSDVISKSSIKLSKFHVIHKDGHLVPVEINPTHLTIEGREYLYGIFRDISERVEAENKVIESEKRYKLLFENMNEAFALHEIITDSGNRPVNYKFIDVNKNFEKMTGLKRDDIIGKRVLQILPNTEDFWIERYGKVALTGEEMVFTDFSKELNKYYEVKAYSPQKNFFAVTFYDVTEKKISEKKLKESEERFRLLVKNSSDCFIEINTEGKVTFVSPVIKKITGYSPDEFIEKSIYDICHEDDIVNITNMWEKLLETPDEIITLPFRQKHKEKGYIYVEAVAQNFFNIPSVRSIVVSLRDITERKRAEEQFKVLIDLAPDAFFQGDEKGAFINVNNAALELTGYSREELLKMNIKDLFDDDEINRKPLRYDLLLKGEVIKAERMLLRKDGEKIIIEMHSKMMPDGKYQSFFRNITTERLTRIMLENENREKRYNNIINSINDCIFMYDRNYRHTFANKKAQVVLNLRKEQLIGKTHKDLGLPDNIVNLWKEKIDKVIESKKPTIFELELTFDNKHMNIEVSLSPEINDNGEVINIIGISRDLTKRKETEKALKKSEKMLQTIFDENQMGMVIVNSKLDYLSVNKKLYEMLEYTEEEFKEKKYEEFTHKDDIEKDMNLTKKLLDGEIDKYSIRKRYIKKDGTIIWCRFHATRTLDDDGNFSLGIGVVENIDDRVKAENLLKESEKHYRTLFENSPVAFHSLNINGEIINVNKAWTDLLKYKKEEVIGKKLTDFLKEEYKKPFLHKFTTLAKTGDLTDNEFEMIRSDGKTIYVLYSGILYRDGTGNFERTQCAIRDISKQKEIFDIVAKSASQRRGLDNFILICAGCNKIGEGDKTDPVWTSPANYISKRLPDIKFSHGICDECMERLYPELTRDDFNSKL